MNLVFLGTPQFAVPTLEHLVQAGHHVQAVLTQPDRPKGRGGQLSASPVKEAAQRHNIPVHQPERIRRPEAGARLPIGTLARLEAGTLTPVPQDNSQATFAPILKKEDGLINWSTPARHIFNRARGFLPWPGIYSTFRGQLIHIWKARPV